MPLPQRKRRLLRIFAISFAACSLSCVSAPKIGPCMVEVKDTVEDSRCYCAPAEGGGAVAHPLRHCDGYTALSPDDTQRLIEWIKRRTRGKAGS